MTEAGAQLVIAPYMSPAVRERLQEAGLAYLDLTGNARLELQKPGLFIETQGARSNPDRSERPARSLRGTKAGKIVRALLEAMDPPGVRDLADRLRIDPGYISRVFALLDSEALIERRGRGRITRVDWERLLRRWAEEAPLDSRGEQATYLEPRGVQSLLSKLGSFEPRYAITGTLAASQFAPIAPPRLATVYVEGAAAASEKLGLRAAESGANVLLIEPNDDTVFENTTQKGPLTIVAVAQAAVDLLTSPGRGPAEAEELIAWMAKNERAWRR